MPKPERRDRIFISYRRADSAGHAGRLKDDLKRALGDRLFMDVSDIAPGADFDRVLRDELASCGAVLAVIGTHWRESFDAPREGPDYVHLELTQALANAGVQVIPVLMQNAILPDATQLPKALQALAGRQVAEIRDERWKDDVAHLARELRKLLKLRHVARWWMAGSGATLAALALWMASTKPPAPGPFSRPRAHELTVAATEKAAAACKPATGLAGECPLVFQFVPDGSARNVYFDSGSCRLKAPPFGDCVLGKLAAVRVAPFNNLSAAEVGLNLRVEANGSIKVSVEQ